MPRLTPTKLFVKDLEKFRSNTAIRKKIVKALALLEANPLHPGLHLERIINDTSAWSARIDGRYRLSLDPVVYLPAGNPDWSAGILLLRILDHDDLYKSPR
jgi:mRNA-degrading endonuclease RelE of RelBE toxin-antitoxin system